MAPASLISTFCLTTASVLALTGCAPKAQPQQEHAAVARPRVVGEVAVVDEEKRFVLIDLESNLYVPLPGAELRTRNATGETAHLRASPEQKRPFIAADILDGEPIVGDEVIQ